MSPNIITLKGEGYKIRLSRSPQDKPELRYRRKVENLARQGKFTRPGRRMLRSLRSQYGLSDEAADAIEAEVLKPFHDYQRKLAEYREALAECLDAGAEPSRNDLIDLKDYQKHLGLKDEDVAAIEQELTGSRLMLAEQPVMPKPKPAVSNPEPAVKQYSTFSFETVRVDAQGKVIKTTPGEAAYFTEDLGSGATLDMVRIPGGKYRMGAAEGEEDARENEYPQHEVTVPEFWMGKYAVTQAQWKAVAALDNVERDLKADPAHFKGAERPVECVYWGEAVEFCQRLLQRTGRDYQLPSEAQWEYACRAGTVTPFYFGPTITPEIVNYAGDCTYGKGLKGIYRQETVDVGSFPPNAFGLYDMHGNVWEWCLDDWHSSYQGAPADGSAWKSSGERKLLRGGSWNDYPRNCGSAFRSSFAPDLHINFIGFRVVCSAPRALP
ncbi:MAG: formylglycine-generating enzyme family protein [Leptolyngbya sp. SIO4C1]|nr:formylglycine-generating enzyme family protein [Leptolyngbya sp. SIO4C1]